MMVVVMMIVLRMTPITLILVRGDLKVMMIIAKIMIKNDNNNVS